MTPTKPSGSRGTRTHKRVFFATCFQDRALIQPDDFLGITNFIADGLGSRGLGPQSAKRVLGEHKAARLIVEEWRVLIVLALECRWRHTIYFGSGGRIRTCELVIQSHGFLPTETTPHFGDIPFAEVSAICCEVPQTNPAGGRRGIRTLKALQLDRLPIGCHHPLACPSEYLFSNFEVAVSAYELTFACKSLPVNQSS